MTTILHEVTSQKTIIMSAWESSSCRVYSNVLFSSIEAPAINIFFPLSPVAFCLLKHNIKPEFWLQNIFTWFIWYKNKHWLFSWLVFVMVTQCCFCGVRNWICICMYLLLLILRSVILSLFLHLILIFSCLILVSVVYDDVYINLSSHELCKVSKILFLVFRIYTFIIQTTHLPAFFFKKSYILDD